MAALSISLRCRSLHEHCARASAIKFTPARGAVALSLSAEGEIAVADSGPGLPPDLKMPCSSASSAATSRPFLRGSGLGPSPAAVTRLHGFALSIENTDPRLPRRPDEDGRLIAPPSSLQSDRLNLGMMG